LPANVPMVCTPLTTLAVTASNTSPNAGDTITLTATPSGFVPTQYQFLLFNGSVTLLSDQAGNTFNWLVNVAAGSYTVYVLATDGVNSAYGTVNINVQGLYLMDIYPSDSIAEFSMFRVSLAFTGRILEVRRTVGAVTTAVEIGFDGNYVTLNSPVLAVTVGSSAAATLGEFVNAAGYANVDSLSGQQSAFAVRGYRQLNGALAWEQTVAANQPRLVNSGTLDTENGTAALVFSGNQWMNFGFINGGNKPADYSLLGVGRIVGRSTSMGWCGSVAGNLSSTDYASIINRNTRPDRLESCYGNETLNLAYVGASTADVFNNTQQLFEVYQTSGVNGIQMHADGAAALAVTDILNTTNVNTGVEGEFRVGRYGSFTGFLLTGSMQMVVVYSENKTADRSGMKAAINSIIGTSW
jgi:hypothetical protein